MQSRNVQMKGLLALRKCLRVMPQPNSCCQACTSTPTAAYDTVPGLDLICVITPDGLPALLRYSSAMLAPSAPCSLMKACILSCKKAATEAASRPDCISTASGSKAMGRRCSLQSSQACTAGL